MAITLDGTAGITTPGLTNTGTETIVSLTTTGNTTLGDATTDTLTVGVTGIVKDASGNVGIGTASPAYRVDIQGTTATQRISSTTGTNAAYQLFSNTGQNFYVGLDNSAGNQILSAAYGATLLGSGAYPMVFGTNNTERMRIDSSGNVLVGLTSGAGERLSVVASSGNATMSVQVSANGNAGVSFKNVSTTTVGQIVVNAATTAYNTSSDYRLKENIVPMLNALAKVAQLKPCTYKWKVDGTDGEGFIAHELSEICPNAVSGEKDAVDENGDIQPQGIDVSFLVATLTAAIQELKALTDAQASTIAALTARITALEAT